MKNHDQSMGGTDTMNEKPMTKQRVEQYKKLQKEITMLEEMITAAETSGVYTSDSVRGSSTQFPYTQHTIKISGFGSRNIPRLCKRRDERAAECEAIEKFIDAIEDSTTWQLFNTKYIEGHTLKQTAETVGYSESQAGRIINDYFKKMTGNAWSCS